MPHWMLVNRAVLAWMGRMARPMLAVGRGALGNDAQRASDSPQRRRRTTATRLSVDVEAEAAAAGEFEVWFELEGGDFVVAEVLWSEGDRVGCLQ